MDDFVWADYVVSGVHFRFESICGLIDSGTPGIRITKISTGEHADYPSVSLVSAYPPTWSFNTIAGSPPAWPGTTLKMRAVVIPTYSQSQVHTGQNGNSLTVTLTSPSTINNLLIAGYVQDGTDVSGGILPAVATPAGWTLAFAASSKRSYLWYRLLAPVTSSLTVTGLSAADLQQMFLAEFFVPPTAALRGSSYKQAQAANTALSSGSIGDSGVTSTFAALMCQSRNAGTSLAAPNFTSISSPWSLPRTARQSVAGGTPIYESLTSGFGYFIEGAPGGSSETVTSDKSQGWDSLAVAIG